VFVRAKDELREALAPARAEGRTIGLVPTMGYLHEGHLALLRAARADCDVVVMSLFVNPTQFGAGEDLERYPRDEERDARLAAEAGVDLIYAPAVADVYPEGFVTAVEVEGLTEVLDGDAAQRGPDHFRGVTTVVAKLFNTVQPDIAYFGQKDAQQLLLIRRMVRDLDFPVDVVSVPTVRESDGLAMSSRNTYLTPSDREVALCLSQALKAGADAASEGPSAIRRAARAVLVKEPLALIDYLVLVHPSTLEDVPEWYRGEALLAVAGRVGTTRLIDNLPIAVGPGGGALEVFSELAGHHDAGAE
jgi:pantoate--beta-alanine ligase